MIATKDMIEPHSSEQLPASTTVFVAGKLPPDIRVPMREIEVSDTKSYTGAIEKNAPVRVYDCSGPWGDPAFAGTSDEGLPALRRDWILKRADVEEYDGREVKPQDNGYLSGKHAEFASVAEKNRLVEFPGSENVPCLPRSVVVMRMRCTAFTKSLLPAEGSPSAGVLAIIAILA